MSRYPRRGASSLLAFAFIGPLTIAAGCAWRTHYEPTKPPVAQRRAADRIATNAGARHPIQEFLTTTSYSGLSFSPDGSKLLVSSDSSGIFNAYAFPTAGGEPEQLTASTTESIFVEEYFPHDERFLYRADTGGDELTHLFVRNLDGSTVDLTPGSAVKASFHRWSADGTWFFVSTNERDKRFFDLYRHRVSDFTRELVYRNDEGYEIDEISPDGRYVALVKQSTNADNDIFIWDGVSAEHRHLTPHAGDVRHEPMDFNASGDSLYYSSDAGTEFAHLVRHHLASDRPVQLERRKWDVTAATVSRSGRYIAVAVNADARTELRLYDEATWSTVPLPDLGDAELSRLTFSRDERQIAFYRSSSRHPQDLLVATIGGAPGRPLTETVRRGVDPDHLVDGEVIRFSSFDGVEIPGILYRPQGVRPRPERYPALVWVHGGPGGQSRIGYHAVIQFLVNHGYVVYAINNRGSSGYGKVFEHLDDQRHGSDDLDDCVAAKRMLVATAEVDPDRIGIIGGSYGGYLTLAALTFRPTEFAVGVDLFGISNWLRTLASIPAWWEAQRAALEREMGPFDDAEHWRKVSPVFHASEIVRPLMVLQGANDPRVHQAESDDIVAAVRKNGVPVEYLIFPDEGHGFRKKENQERGYAAILSFLDAHL